MKKIFLFLIIYINLLYAQTIKINSGTNFLTNEYDNLNVKKTFSNKSIQKVKLFDKLSNKQAVFPYEKENLKLISIEKGLKYEVISNKDIILNVNIDKITSKCEQLLNDKSYNKLYDSGINSAITYNKNKDLGISSRYISNYKKDKYTNTNIVLFYKKKKIKTKQTLKYGPAIPKIMIYYNKIYENQEFYLFNYFNNKCYRGIFPSVNIPPFMELQELND